MENEEIKLNSGNIVTFQFAGFLKVKKLFGVLAIEAKKDGYNLFEPNKGNPADMLSAVIVNEEVEKQFWNCADVSLWNGERITPKLFEDIPDAIGDYIEIKDTIINKNIGIFFSHQSSRSSKKAGK